MKSFYHHRLETQENKKLIYYLESYKPEEMLIIFDHGLGDAVEFLDIFETLKKDYPKWKFTIGSHPTLNLSILHKDWIDIKELNKNFVIPFNKSIVQMDQEPFRYDLNKLHKKYKFIFSIKFSDARHPLLNPVVKMNISKTDRCKVLEIGYNDTKVLEKYVPPFFLNNLSSKHVMYHIGGVTDKAIKNPDEKTSELIWNEIIQAGFTPVDIHVNNASTLINSKIPTPDFMKTGLSIRDTVKSMQGLIDTMCTGKYLVGVLSGPLHLANRLYGPENCLALEGMFKIHNYIGSPELKTVTIQPEYKEGEVFNWLKSKEN